MEDKIQAGLAEQSKTPDWQDPALLADIKAETGLDLKIKTKADKKKTKKYQGLSLFLSLIFCSIFLSFPPSFLHSILNLRCNFYFIRRTNRPSRQVEHNSESIVEKSFQSSLDETGRSFNRQIWRSIQLLIE